MRVASYLLLLLGALGATDIVLYHSLAHGIRQHPDARHELVVHSLRGPTYAALFLIVPNFALHGAFSWAFIGLLAFDLALSIWDFAIEGESRRFFGGLPPGEYVLHIVIAMLFGAMIAAVCFESGVSVRLPTALVYEPAVPIPVRLLFVAMALGVLWSGAQDAHAAWQLRRAPRLAETAPDQTCARPAP